MTSTLTILVVGPATALRSSVHAVLTSAGHTVLLSDNPASAIDVPAALQPDLILTDAEPPGWDAAGLIRTVRSGSRADTPVFVVSNDSSCEVRSRMARAGANGWISAPVSTGVLLAAVEAVARSVQRAAAPSQPPVAALAAGGDRYSYVQASS